MDKNFLEVFRVERERIGLNVVVGWIWLWGMGEMKIECIKREGLGECKGKIVDFKGNEEFWRGESCFKGLGKKN